MQTMTKVLANIEDYKKSIVRGAIRRIGKDSIQDVVNHGADTGYSGFTYYKDTCEFYRKHRNGINQWVKEMAQELGEDSVSMVANFGCLKGSEWREEIGQCLYGAKLTEETTIIENALAWFALEESCRLFDND